MFYQLNRQINFRFSRFLLVYSHGKRKSDIAVRPRNKDNIQTENTFPDFTVIKPSDIFNAPRELFGNDSVVNQEITALQFSKGSQNKVLQECLPTKLFSVENPCKAVVRICRNLGQRNASGVLKDAHQTL